MVAVMRALLCEQFGPPETLVVEEVPDPEPGPGQVVVDVAGCGVNFPDVLMIEDKYQFKPGLPFSPGGEIAGDRERGRARRRRDRHRRTGARHARVGRDGREGGGPRRVARPGA